MLISNILQKLLIKLLICSDFSECETWSRSQVQQVLDPPKADDELNTTVLQTGQLKASPNWFSFRSLRVLQGSYASFLCLLVSPLCLTDYMSPVEDVQYLSCPLTGNGTLGHMQKIRVSQWGMCLSSCRMCLSSCRKWRKDPLLSVFFFSS